MSNDVLLVPINVEQPNVEAQSDVVVYVPQAHKNKAGIVKEGEGINIENGVVSLDTQTVEDMIDANKWVSYGFQQNLTEDEKGMARHNIGAGDNDFTGSYYDVTQKPHLSTDNSVSLPIGDEEINNTVQLHKISKTGSFNDLNAVPHETLDFAESERQKSKNLYTNKVRNENVYGMVWKNENGRITVIGTPNGDYTENFEKQPLNIEKAGEYTLSVHNSDQSFAFGLWVYDKNDNLLATFSDRQGLTHELDEDAVSCRPFIEDLISGNSYAFNFNIQLEYGLVATDYQPYHGLITHNGDAPVVFAEAERQKSKNLLVYPYTGKIASPDITIAENGDGSFTINGQKTLTDTNSVYFLYTFNNWTDKISPFKLSAGTYTAGLFANVDADIQLVFTEGTQWINVDLNNQTTITVDEDTYFEIYLQVPRHNTAVFNNLVVYPMLVKGTDLGEWQSYNGAIVHEKDVADVEHIETIYNINTKNVLNGVAYTNGIVIGTNIISSEFANYKKFIIKSYRNADILTTELYVFHENVNISGNVVLDQSGDYFVIHSFSFNKAYNSFTFLHGGYMYVNDGSSIFTQETADSNNLIVEILGVK